MTNTKSSQQIAQEVLPSTVLLEMKDSNGQLRSSGSGFFVRAGEIATNFHVVEEAYEGSAKLFGQAERYDIEGYIALDVNNDLIILKIKDQAQTIVDGAALPLGDSESVRTGDQIYAVGNPEGLGGNPGGLEGTISDGIVSGIRKLNGIYDRIQITAPISPGNSGGPVLNTNGEVIGVSVQALPSLSSISLPNLQETQYINRAQNLNLAIPSKILDSLCQNIDETSNPIPLEKATLQRVVPIRNFGWVGSASYTFSLLNRSSRAIKNVRCVVNFKDETGNVFKQDVFLYPWLIPANNIKVVIRLSTYDTGPFGWGTLEGIQLLQGLDVITYDKSEVNKSPIESFLLGLADMVLTNMKYTNYSEIEPNVKRLMVDYEIRVIDLEVAD